jgi:hypothetical protein
MKDQHFYADVDLPFHVWVRERSGCGFGWVLRDASQMQAGAPQRGGSTNDTPGEAAP